MTRILILLILSSAAVAGAPVTLRPPISGDGAAGDFFGVQLYSDPEWLMVGAYGDLINSVENFVGLKSGSVKIYRKTQSGPEPFQVLVPPAPTPSTLFGDEIQRVGNRLVISAPRFSSGVGGQEGGGVFVFSLVAGQWAYERTLVPPSTGGFGRFGESILLRDTELWIGAPQRGNGGEVFRYDLVGGSMTPTATLQSPIAGALFGQAMVALETGQIAIGAPGAGRVLLYPLSGALVVADTLSGPPSFGNVLASANGALVVSASDAGSGRVFRWVRDGTNWIAQPELTPAAGEAGDQFGASLLVLGNALFIGAPGTNRGTDFDVGAVYQAPLAGPATLDNRTLPDLPLSTLFGSALAADESDSQVWVGAPLLAVSHQRSGSILAYLSNTLGMPQAQPARDVDRGAGAQLFRFAQAVAIDGARVLGGAFLADTSVGADSGAVYAFRSDGSGWAPDGRLTPNDGLVDQRLGLSLDIAGDHAVVGAYWDVVANKPEQGSAYFFRRTGSGWVQERKVFAANGTERDNFGAAVAIDGDLAVVGARGANLQFVDQGAVNVYQRIAGQWTALTQLRASPSAGGDFFGQAVAVCGNRIVVGAPGADAAPDSQESGLAYVFSLGANDVLQRAVLTPEVADESVNFGFAVACYGDLVAVGAPGAGDVLFAGEVQLFNCTDNGCTRERTLRAADATPGDQLGIAVAVHGERVLAGMVGRDVGGLFDVGAALLFEREAGSWSLLEHIAAPVPVALGSFGRAVDMDERRIVIGSPTSAGDNPAEGTLVIRDQPGFLLRDGFED